MQKRALGPLAAIALVVGNMIGSGVFLLPSSLAGYGLLSLWGWGITSIGATFVALVFVTLSRSLPAAGGPYAYARRGFGEFAGFLVAWGYWISIWTANAAIAVAFVGYFSALVPAVNASPLRAAATAVAVIWLLTWVNARGVREAGIVQVVTTGLKLLPLLLVAGFGLFYFDSANLQPIDNLKANGLAAIGATAALTLWAFLGLESATIPADEIEDPARSIPRATILGVLLAAGIYFLSNLAVLGLVPAATLATSPAPFAEAGQRMWGTWAATIMAVGGAVSTLGALNGWTLLAGQLPLAAAQDQLLPTVLTRRSRRGTPIVGLGVSSLMVTLLISMNYTQALVEQFTFIILLSTLATLIPYVFTSAALLLLWQREPQLFPGLRPWRVFFLGTIAFVYSLVAVAGAGAETVYWGFLLLLAGLPLYVWQVGRRSRQLDS